MSKRLSLIIVAVFDLCKGLCCGERSAVQCGKHTYHCSDGFFGCVPGNAGVEEFGGKCASTRMVLTNSVLTCVCPTQTTATNVSFNS